jgi:glyoxalase family protein
MAGGAMQQPIAGIHHVTAIASDPQRNLDFYTDVLGLRLIKRTVNFDDPGSYHFYFGDELGSPGTILTFFAWPGAARGRSGAGQVTVTSFAVPEQSLKFWEKRLLEAGLPVEKMRKRFGEEVLTFADPDGLKLEIVADPTNNNTSPAQANRCVPSEHAIRGFHSITLCEQGYEHTAQTLEKMGFRKVAEEDNRFRYEVGGGGRGTRADLLCAPEAPHGRVAVGTVHHVAWRVADDESQRLWRTRLIESHLDVTPVMDRCYFHSVYFREPGGVLFELATDPPGFATDESPDKLGQALKLPPWLEEYRSQIEQALPQINLHTAAKEKP